MADAIITGKQRLEALNELSANLVILSANLHAITGEGAESFRALSEKLSDNYLWGCSRLVDSALEHLEKVSLRSEA